VFVNSQRKVKVDADTIRTFVSTLSSHVSEAAESTFDVALISDRRMIELNRFFRGKDLTTDVLSFPHEADEFAQSAGSVGDLGEEEQNEANALNVNFLGDIVISAEQAERQAIENELTLENEIKQLILHGLLHLCGYDHETDDGEMNRREIQLRRKLAI
jgi:probable rRNA maturation factor